MCYQLIEHYSKCRCMYYQHQVDRCSAYGRPGHGILQRTIYVGYLCSTHSQSRGSRPEDFLVTTRREEISQRKLAARAGPVNKFGLKWVDAAAKAGVVLQEPDNSTDEPEMLLELSDSNSDADSEDLFSDVSHASSVTSAAVLETTEIFQRLLVFGELRFLWPQVVRKCGDKGAALRTIRRFLQRYSDDLVVAAASPVAVEKADSTGKTAGEREARIHTRTGLLFAKVKRDIAQRIWEAHSHLGNEFAEDCAKEHRDDCFDSDLSTFTAEDEETSKDLDVQGFVYAVAEEFLFETDPIHSLQANIRSFLAQPPPQPLWHRLFQRLQVAFENLVDDMSLSPPHEGATRVVWKCTCGRKITDDYRAHSSFAATNPYWDGRGETTSHEPRIGPTQFTRLLEEIESCAGSASSRNLTAENMDDPGGKASSSARQKWTSFTQGVNDIIRSLHAPKLPRHRQDNSSHTSGIDMGQIGRCPPHNTAPGAADRRSHMYALLCVPFMRTAAKLFQVEACTINSDQEFFQALRYHYPRWRGRVPWTRLRKVKTLRFVKFEVYQSELVDIKQCPSLPPVDLRAVDYEYEPAESVPPIGSRLLTHLFEHPDHAEVLPVLFRRIPRKLKTKLQACHRKGSSVGWGIEMAEGLNWFALFAWGCVGFLACLVTAVAWTLAREDVQGGFAIASFMLAFLVFSATVVHSEMAAD